MRYPFEYRNVKPLKDSKWAIPPEQRATLIEDLHYDVPTRIKEVGDHIYEEFKKVAGTTEKKVEEKAEKKAEKKSKKKS